MTDSNKKPHILIVGAGISFLQYLVPLTLHNIYANKPIVRHRDMRSPDCSGVEEGEYLVHYIFFSAYFNGLINHIPQLLLLA